MKNHEHGEVRWPEATGSDRGLWHSMCQAEGGSGNAGWPALHIEDLVLCISKFSHQTQKLKELRKKGLIFPLHLLYNHDWFLIENL